MVSVLTASSIPLDSASTDVPECKASSFKPINNNKAPVTINAGPGVSFVLRPFPPPNLVGVPIEYVVTQLRKLAPHYWSKNETADCTIIVPMAADKKYRSRRLDSVPTVSRTFPAASDPLTTGPFAAQTTDRRGSAPIPNDLAKKRLVVRLHRDYLSSQSTFLRAMFSGASPLDLANPMNPKPTSKLSAGAFPVPMSAQPRLLPCSPNHPQLFLPLPDPSSFPHLIHYLYFGKISYIEESLCRGSITWEGIVRNVEYLGLREDIKIFLGRWWGNWLDPTRHCRRNSVSNVSITMRHTVTIPEDSDGEEAGDEADRKSNGSPSGSPRSRPSSKSRSKRRSLSKEDELQYPPSP